MHITVDLMKHECPCSIRKMNYYKTLLLQVQRVRERSLEKVFLSRGDGNVCTVIQNLLKIPQPLIIVHQLKAREESSLPNNNTPRLQQCIVRKLAQP